MEIILAFIFSFITYMFAAEPIMISGKSMEPNYKHGQYYLAEKVTYQKKSPARGDAVLYMRTLPSGDIVKMIGRVVGLPNDEFTLRNNQIFINNQLLSEPYLKSNTQTMSGAFITQGNSIVVPPDSYIILGDNRNFSLDSRATGFVTKQAIVGKVGICYYKCD